MAVTDANFLMYATTNIPTDNIAIAGGAIDLANQINDLDAGKVFGGYIPAAAGDIPYYAKVHEYNNHATDAGSENKMYMDNLLDDPTATGVITVTTNNVADDNTKKLRFKFENSLAVPSEEDLVLPAVPGGVNTVTQFLINRRYNVELRDVGTSALVAAAGDIDFTDSLGVSLGKIPAGYQTATGSFDIGLSAVLDDVATIANRLTAPGGIIFSRARTEATAIDCANAKVVTALTNQAVWVRWLVQANMIGSDLLELGIGIFGYGS